MYVRSTCTKKSEKVEKNSAGELLLPIPRLLLMETEQIYLLRMTGLRSNSFGWLKEKEKVTSHSNCVQWTCRDFFLQSDSGR